MAEDTDEGILGRADNTYRLHAQEAFVKYYQTIYINTLKLP